MLESARRAFAELSERIDAALPEIMARRFEITEKSDGSYVTSGDLLVERIVLDFVRTWLPGAAFISEETPIAPDIDFGGPVILLDPIDGTENFCSGLKEWGVGISFWNGGTHVASMLLLPELGERLMTGDPIPAIKSRIVGLSSSMSDELRAELARDGEYRIMGCAVYNMFNVVRGAYARFVNPKGAYVWDLVPGLMLALEHGCEVKVNGEDYDGRALDPSRRHRVDIHSRHHSDRRQGAIG